MKSWYLSEKYFTLSKTEEENMLLCFDGFLTSRERREKREKRARKKR